MAWASAVCFMGAGILALSRSLHSVLDDGEHDANGPTAVPILIHAIGQTGLLGLFA